MDKERDAFIAGFAAGWVQKKTSHEAWNDYRNKHTSPTQSDVPIKWPAPDVVIKVETHGNSATIGDNATQNTVLSCVLCGKPNSQESLSEANKWHCDECHQRTKTMEEK